MWPFKKKSKLPDGLQYDGDGNLVFELTKEEEQKVNECFRTLYPQAHEGGGLAIHKSVAEEFRTGMVARGLYEYAFDQIALSKQEAQTSNQGKLIDMAIASIMKAFTIYQLPIYVYDLACFMEMNGRLDLAKGVFKEFLDLQDCFRPSEFMKTTLDSYNRDIDTAIRNARQKLKSL